MTDADKALEDLTAIEERSRDNYTMSKADKSIKFPDDYQLAIESGFYTEHNIVIKKALEMLCEGTKNK